MIKTEIFSSKDDFHNVLNMVNNLIKKNNIQKEDILEYRTKYYQDNEGDYFFEVVISYWINT